MRIQITNSIPQIDRVHSEFVDFAKHTVKDQSVVQKLCIVIDEVLTNIINHGYRDHSNHQIAFHAYIENNNIIFEIQDDGVAFNPLLIDLANATLNPKSKDEGGLGIYLMKHLVDDIQYERIDEMNLLKITKCVM